MNGLMCLVCVADDNRVLPMLTRLPRHNLPETQTAFSILYWHYVKYKFAFVFENFMCGSKYRCKCVNNATVKTRF